MSTDEKASSARQKAKEEFAERIMRPPRALSVGDLLASEMALGTIANPSAKIRHALEAMMLLNRPEREKVKITDEEYESNVRLYGISRLLADNPHMRREMLILKLGRICSKEEAEFFSKRLCDPGDSYSEMLSTFIEYAMPIAVNLMRRIVTLVSSEAYLDTLAALRGAHKRET